VVFSYAKESAEGRQRASQVLEGLELDKTTAAELLAPETPRVVVSLEEVEDDVTVAALPDRVIRGGAMVLQLQAACGFRAFAEHRLGSTELASVDLGIDALESGIVVHTVMEIFWGQVKTQDALRKMTMADREAVLDAAIGEGLKKICATERLQLGCRLRGSAAGTAATIAVAMAGGGVWRDQSFSVKQREEKASDVQIGPLHLNLRIDRVDETAGGELVIDYKTGRAATNDWLSERPDAPQLPLYAVVSDAERLGGCPRSRA